MERGAIAYHGIAVRAFGVFCVGGDVDDGCPPSTAYMAVEGCEHPDRLFGEDGMNFVVEGYHFKLLL